MTEMDPRDQLLKEIPSLNKQIKGKKIRYENNSNSIESKREEETERVY